MATERRIDKVAAIITERIIGLLKSGTVPWHKPWKGSSMIPKRENGKPYRGINLFILACAGFANPFFLTYRKVKELGGDVRPGEKGWPVVFWKPMEIEEEDRNGNPTGRVRKVFFLRYYTVFNVEQCANLPDRYTKVDQPKGKVTEKARIKACDAIVNGYKDGPEIQIRGDRACYSPALDMVRMPAKTSFDGIAEYYSTLFHELTHSTGHAKRLNREELVKSDGMGGEKYSKEELVAEMGAAMLCGMAGIENKTADNSAAYIKHWLQKLQDDERFVILAAGCAQKALDCILGTTFEERAESEEKKVVNG